MSRGLRPGQGGLHSAVSLRGTGSHLWWAGFCTDPQLGATAAAVCTSASCRLRRTRVQPGCTMTRGCPHTPFLLQVQESLLHQLGEEKRAFTAWLWLCTSREDGEDDGIGRKAGRATGHLAWCQRQSLWLCQPPSWASLQVACYPSSRVLWSPSYGSAPASPPAPQRLPSGSHAARQGRGGQKLVALPCWGLPGCSSLPCFPRVALSSWST